MLSIARPFTKKGRNMPKIIGQSQAKKFDISMGGKLIEIPIKAQNGETWLVRLDDGIIDLIHNRLHARNAVKPRVPKEDALSTGGVVEGEKETVDVNE